MKWDIRKYMGGDAVKPTVVDSEAEYNDALALAEMYAQEHAERLSVKLWRYSHNAWRFVTNNGTAVTYEVY